MSVHFSRRMAVPLDAPLLTAAAFRRQFGICLVLVCAVLIIESVTNIDMTLQCLLYDPTTQQWQITREQHEAWSWLFYSGPKWGLGLLGGGSLVVFAFSFSKGAWLQRSWNLSAWQATAKGWRRPALMLFASLTLVPLLVAGSKQFTNVYCPKQLTVFGGDKTYSRILPFLEDVAPSLCLHNEVLVDQRNLPPPQPESRGKCFPAGHSTGGFALMALAFVGISRQRRYLGLGVGLLSGWIMGTYQMLRGEHFLSHTLTSMIAAWMVILIVAYAVQYVVKPTQPAP